MLSHDSYISCYDIHRHSHYATVTKIVVMPVSVEDYSCREPSGEDSEENKTADPLLAVQNIKTKCGVSRDSHKNHGDIGVI